MPVQPALILEALRTVRAAVRALRGVHDHVRLHRAGAREHALAHVALEALRVCFSTTTITKPGRTYGRTGTSDVDETIPNAPIKTINPHRPPHPLRITFMRPHVLTQRAVAAEPLAADVAHVMALPRVRQLVRHKLILEQIVLAAYGTHKTQPRPFAMAESLVFAQTVRAHVLAIALIALERRRFGGQRLAHVHFDAVAAECVAGVEALQRVCL